MNESELRKDWLVSNSLTAFVGALLLAQSWQMSEGTVKLLFIFTVHDFTWLVIFIVIAGLFILSLFLALAAVVPVSRLQSRALSAVTHLSPTLGLLTWFSFTIGLMSAIPDLPLDQWWSAFLILGGFVLWLFLLYRMFAEAKRVGAAPSVQASPPPD